jgi:hypothetical protein
MRRGEITPAEGAHIAKRVDARLRAGQRLGRLERRSALQSSLVRTPPDSRDNARGFA